MGSVAYEKDKACGAIKEYSGDTVEIKRMYTRPSYRGKCIATKSLAGLQTWAAELAIKNVYWNQERNSQRPLPFIKKTAGVETACVLKKRCSTAFKT